MRTWNGGGAKQQQRLHFLEHASLPDQEEKSEINQRLHERGLTIEMMHNNRYQPD